jgi:hypothetical protein
LCDELDQMYERANKVITWNKVILTDRLVEKTADFSNACRAMKKKFWRPEESIGFIEAFPSLRLLNN